MKTKDITTTFETVDDVREHRIESTGCIFQLTNSPIGLIIYVAEDDVYAMWDGQDEFQGGNSHLINTHEGFEPTPVLMIAHHVTMDELPEASARIRRMKDIK